MPLLPLERFSKTKFSGGHGELVPKGFRGDLFVAKLNPSGSALVFSTYLGGTGDEGLGALRVDGTRNVYVAGTTTSPDFPMTTGAFQTHWWAVETARRAIVEFYRAAGCELPVRI